MQGNSAWYNSIKFLLTGIYGTSIAPLWDQWEHSLFIPKSSWCCISAAQLNAGAMRMFLLSVMRKDWISERRCISGSSAVITSEINFYIWQKLVIQIFVPSTKTKVCWLFYKHKAPSTFNKNQHTQTSGKYFKVNPAMMHLKLAPSLMSSRGWPVWM